MISWTGLSGLAQGGQSVLHRLRLGGGITWSIGATTTTTNITAQPGVNAILDSGIYRFQETVTEGCMLVAVIIDSHLVRDF